MIASVMMFFVSFVRFIPNVVDRLEIALTFCGTSEAVPGPYLDEGSLNFGVVC